MKMPDFWRRSRWSGSLAATAAIAVGLFLWWEAKRVLQVHAIEDRRLLVLAHDLPAEFPIQPSDFVFAFETGKPDTVRLSDQDFYLIQGAKTARALRRGDTVGLSDFLLPGRREALSTRVPEGTRAFAVIVAKVSGPRAGDRVDVLFQSFRAAESPLLVLEGALLLGIAPAEAGTEALLALSTEEILAVQSLRPQGTLSIVLRNPREAVPKHRLRVRGRRARAAGVRIWNEAEG